MSRFDRIAADMRAAALREPQTRARSIVLPGMVLKDGIMLALSFNF